MRAAAAGGDLAHPDPAHDPRDPARLSEARRAGARADGVAGLLLQRDLLLLCAGADPLLRRAVGCDRLVHAALRDRQFHGAIAARTAVRHARAQANDRLHLRDLGVLLAIVGWLFRQEMVD